MRKPLGVNHSVVGVAVALALMVACPCQEHGHGKAETAQQDKPVNRLGKESSPYLRQHQYNPVDWYPWGPEALALAKKLDKPIFLSIGYSACHWCHVMAGESFSDPDIARLMNDKFVCIKVDREERPDIDEIYMGALHAMGQRGGWPLSAWLTPTGRPFYGGTYFPPEDMGQRPGFRRVCTALASAWEDRRKDVLKGADDLTNYLEKSLAPALVAGEPTTALFDKVLGQSRARFDPVHGGFAGEPHYAPKFPHSTELMMLMRLHDKAAHEMAHQTLHKMRRGGMHDQLGGGFHRYSTDRQWLVPHFEKMLYDNALLVPCYLDGYHQTEDQRFAEVARTTLDYLLREMQSPSGGFWSSQDAQSEGVEGKFFVWQLDEVRQLLGPDTDMVAKVFGISEAGNWEHKNVLWLADEDAATDALGKARKLLLAAREKRIKMGTDDKVLASWNGMTLTALSDGYRVLGDVRYLRAAKRCASFLLDKLVQDGRVHRSFQGDQARHQGYLEDHAALAGGLLSLFEVDSDPRWLKSARDILEQTATHFRAEDGAFYFTADDHEELLARTKSGSEGATPPGNALAASAFLRGGLLLGDERLYGYGVDVLRAYHKLLLDSPSSAPSLLIAAQFHLGKPKEVVIAGDPSDARTHKLLHAAWNAFPQPRVVTLLHDGNRAALEKISPVFRGKHPLAGPAAYVCERGTCLAPVTDADALAAALKAPESAAPQSGKPESGTPESGTPESGK